MSTATRTDGSCNVLLSVVGMSPAVLTETVWALVHQNPPWIPDRVVAITTSDGRSAIQTQLLESGVWGDLRRALTQQGFLIEGKLKFGSSDSIRVVSDGENDFSDIITPEQNRTAADYILSVLREYTENSETEIVASIAGGRKTMSALMLACISLLGREQDRVCHVLANDEYLVNNRSFFFPRNKQEEGAAQIQLSEIPFIRVRGWYEQETGKRPASYNHMVSLFRTISPEAVVEPPVVLDLKNETLTINGKQLHITSREFQVVSSFIRMRKSDTAKTGQLAKSEDDFRRGLSSVRKKAEAVIGKTRANRLFPDSRKTKYEYRNIQIKPGRPKTS